MINEPTMHDGAGEWWNVDPEAVISQALQTGAGPNVSDAYTFNGLPGPLYNCSQNGTHLHITKFWYHQLQTLLNHIFGFDFRDL